MKHIPIWKIIVFSIITLGIYDIVWYILRQREMESTHGLKMPHWLWMIVPQAILACVIATLFTLTLILGNGQLLPAHSLLFLFLILPLAIAALGLAIWWLIGFSRAAAKVIAGRVPTGWSLALFLLVGNVAQIIALQYYFNRYAGDTLPVKTVGPSQKFRNIAILIIVISIASGIISDAASIPTQSYAPEKIQPQQ
jgi:heme/copper-type cytochrome/quinol oxidase subunit 2